MADTPQFLTLSGNRDRSETYELALRRTFFGLLTVVVLAALLNVFGQRPTNTLAAASVADLQVFVPARLRGGLYYEGRITVRGKAGHRESHPRARLRLDRADADQHD